MTDRDPERGAVDVLLGALTGTALLPFVQAIATKGGEDAYAKIKHVLSRKGRRRAKGEIKDVGTVTLVFPEERIVLRVPATMTATASEQLAQVRLPARRDEWLRISRDQATSRWVVLACDPPEELAH
ncbi:hypothetical protein KDL01_09000 [Actinospica durhamensis]|uniref:Uncharacterized protein n=1 Tax=Actinospica durhamensis TaxID=1508375 RepID=A0A941EL95_9ACTN|nr:hypothetical protein [Actinospica durhamensis]MBR7833401.1 hypothetical protein [Actinospica durhamensis]